MGGVEILSKMQDKYSELTKLEESSMVLGNTKLFERYALKLYKKIIEKFNKNKEEIER